MYLGIPSQLAQTYWLCLKDFSGLCYTSWEKTKMKVVVENHLFRPTPPPGFLHLRYSRAASITYCTEQVSKETRSCIDLPSTLVILHHHHCTCGCYVTNLTIEFKDLEVALKA